MARYAGTVPLAWVASYFAALRMVRVWFLAEDETGHVPVWPSGFVWVFATCVSLIAGMLVFLGARFERKLWYANQVLSVLALCAVVGSIAYGRMASIPAGSVTVSAVGAIAALGWLALSVDYHRRGK